MKQHRTGRTLVTLADDPWKTSSATGRRWLDIRVYADEFVVESIATGGEELARVANAVRAAAREALELKGA
jgi:hypothetical protein